MLTKFASAQVISAGMAHKSGSLIKDAHRHEFDYDPRPGYLYVRSRAISSRTNDNYDNFPAEEIKKAYRTFIGKPVFVNHHNENHRRARGVIVDAALHEDTTPQGEKDTWVEVLMEVDAVNYPKLAQAILAGEIDRTSMGTDVAYSICSVCNNKAETPLQYCAHIPKMKGLKVRRTTASGTKEDVLVYEKCYGLSFFENSLLVEEPADPTAYFLGVDDRGLSSVASLRKKFPRRRLPKTAYGEEVVPAPVDTLRDENCPICGEADSFDGDTCMVCQYVKPPDEFMDPDLEKAKEIDLRQDEEAEPIGEADADPFGPQAEGEEEDPFGPQKEGEEGEDPFGPKSEGEDGEEDPDAEAEGDGEDGEVEEDSKFPESTEKSEDSEAGEEEAPEGESKEKPGAEGDKPEDKARSKEKPKEDASKEKSEDEPEGKSKDKPKGESEEGESEEPAEGEDEEEDEDAAPSGNEIHPAFQNGGSSEEDDDEESEDKPHTLKFKKKKSSINTGGIDMRPALEALRKQQATINRQNKRIAALTEGLRFIAQAAGIEKHPQVVAILKTAEQDENPAQPDGWAAGGDGSDAPVTTSEETLGEVDRNAPGGGNMANDPQDMGETTEADTAPAATTDLESSQTVLDEPLDLNEEDVTEVVSGTDDLGEGPAGQAGSGRTETEVRIGDPNNPEPAFDDASFSEASKKEGRSFAALRLARLRIQAGIEKGDDLALGTTIANSEMSDQAIAAEIETLAKVVTATKRSAKRPVPRRLVPRSASAGQVERTMPSFQAPTVKVASAPGDDEFLFE